MTIHCLPWLNIKPPFILRTVLHATVMYSLHQASYHEETFALYFCAARSNNALFSSRSTSKRCSGSASLSDLLPLVTCRRANYSDTCATYFRYWESSFPETVFKTNRLAIASAYWGSFDRACSRAICASSRRPR